MTALEGTSWPAASSLKAVLPSLDLSERTIGWIIGLLTLCRLLLAGVTDLSEDEAYYWLWSTQPALGYFDHPPMVAYWIRAGTLVFGQTVFGTRVVFVISILAASYWLRGAALSLFGNRRLAAHVALWFNAMLVTSTFAIVATPDTPLLVFSCLTLFALAKLVETANGRWWLLVGFALGAGFLSKYTASLLLPGLVIWMVATPFGRRWFRSPQLYLGALVGLLVIAPLIYWNFVHEWVSFLKQIEHSSKDVPASAAASFVEFFGAQMGVVTPLMFAFCLVGSALALARGFKSEDPAWLLPGALFLPPFIYFAVHSFSQKIQANWPVFLYAAGVLAAVPWAMQVIEAKPGRSPLLSWAFRAAPSVGLAITMLAFIQLGFSAFPLPQRLDPTLRLKGWSSLGQTVEKVRIEAGAGDILTDRYATTGELAFNTGRPATVFQLNQRMRYVDFPAPDQATLRGAPALLVVQAGHDVSQWAAFFETSRPLIALKRNAGSAAKDNYDVYLLSGYRGGLFGAPPLKPSE